MSVPGGNALATGEDISHSTISYKRNFILTILVLWIVTLNLAEPSKTNLLYRLLITVRY
jgi:hypothetical protein